MKQFKSLRAAIKHKFDVFASAAKQAEPHLGDDELRTMFMQMGPKDEEKLALDPGLEIKVTRADFSGPGREESYTMGYMHYVHTPRTSDGCLRREGGLSVSALGLFRSAPLFPGAFPRKSSPHPCSLKSGRGRVRSLTTISRITEPRV